jgi:hypothetical protein
LATDAADRIISLSFLTGNEKETTLIAERRNLTNDFEALPAAEGKGGGETMPPLPF